MNNRMQTRDKNKNMARGATRQTIGQLCTDKTRETEEETRGGWGMLMLMWTTDIYRAAIKHRVAAAANTSADGVERELSLALVLVPVATPVLLVLLLLALVLPVLLPTPELTAVLTPDSAVLFVLPPDTVDVMLMFPRHVYLNDVLFPACTHAPAATVSWRSGS